MPKKPKIDAPPKREPTWDELFAKYCERARTLIQTHHRLGEVEFLLTLILATDEEKEQIMAHLENHPDIGACFDETPETPATT